MRPPHVFPAARAVFVLPLALWLALTLTGVAVERPARAAGGRTVRVGLARACSEVTVGSQGKTLVVSAIGSPVGYIDEETTISSPGGEAVSLAGIGVFSGPLVLRPSGGELTAPGYAVVGGRPYRGELEVFARDGLITVVNVLPLEEYLLGVVPSEMPFSFPMEALKAQAVAARTYALHTQAAGAYSALGYDLVPTTACQVYGGVRAEQETTTEAVRSTAGEVATYGGALIGAYFHSTSGGHTESVEYVWGSASPYLKGVPDYDQDSPHFSWIAVFEAAKLAASLRQAGYDVGDVWSIEGVAPQGPGGRYLERRLTGSAGEARLRSETLRAVLGLRSAWFDVVGEEERIADVTRRVDPADLSAVAADGSVAPLVAGALATRNSDYAYVLRTTDLWAVTPVLTPATFTFSGHGWGHGVGLSQWGARGMALAGQDYRQILTHYYTGVTVGTLP